MQPEKCNTCEFWDRHGESENSPGNCHRKPPMIQFVAVEQSSLQKLNKQPAQFGMQPYFPVTLPTGFCGEHPDAVHRRAEWMKNAEAVKYNPSDFGDGNAGFNKAPTLAEAMKYSQKDQIESMRKRYVFLRDIGRPRTLDENRELDGLETALEVIEEKSRS